MGNVIKADKEIDAINKDKKICPAEKAKKRKQILDKYQKNSLLNVADVLTPGTGVKAAAAACVVFALTF